LNNALNDAETTLMELDGFDDGPAPAELEAVAASLRRLPHLGPSEAELAAWIQRITLRDDRALAELYDATVSRTYGVAMRVLRQAALAEEAVEEAYFQVWRQAPRFDPARGKALTWLLGIVRSRAIDTLRKEARFTCNSLDVDAAPETADEHSPQDDLLDVARAHADLHRALLLLGARPRQLVALAFFRGLTHEEISDQTQLPLGTVKSQIRRALAVLRQVLGAQGTSASSAFNPATL
jgi:RNA polymerase sigma factor (sigma-70 family)